jgi:hypothetical protein
MTKATVSNPAPEPSSAMQTPTDSPVPREKQKHPNRGKRKRVLGEGDGDYCIYMIVGAGHPHVPAGSLVPIPNVPRFTSTALAMAWMRKESGDLLIDKQVMIFRACEIISLEVEKKPVVTFRSKPKVLVNKAPETSDG